MIVRQKKDAESLLRVIDYKLVEFGIKGINGYNVHFRPSIASDNASNYGKCFRGYDVVIHLLCINHNLNLAVEHAVTGVKRMCLRFRYMLDSYGNFVGSIKRGGLMANFNPTLKKQGATRWKSIANVFDAIAAKAPVKGESNNYMIMLTLLHDKDMAHHPMIRYCRKEYRILAMFFNYLKKTHEIFEYENRPTMHRVVPACHDLMSTFKKEFPSKNKKSTTNNNNKSSKKKKSTEPREVRLLRSQLRRQMKYRVLCKITMYVFVSLQHKFSLKYRKQPPAAFCILTILLKIILSIFTLNMFTLATTMSPRFSIPSTRATNCTFIGRNFQILRRTRNWWYTMPRRSMA